MWDFLLVFCSKHEDMVFGEQNWTSYRLWQILFSALSNNSGGMRIKREGKRSARLIFLVVLLFSEGRIFTHTWPTQRHREGPVTSLQHTSPEQPSRLEGTNEGTSKSNALPPCLPVYICFMPTGSSQVQLSEQGPHPGIGLWGNKHCPTLLCLLIRGKCVCGTAAAALEGKTYSWHASAVITRSMWDGRTAC